MSSLKLPKAEMEWIEAARWATWKTEPGSPFVKHRALVHVPVRIVRVGWKIASNALLDYLDLVWESTGFGSVPIEYEPITAGVDPFPVLYEDLALGSEQQGYNKHQVFLRLLEAR